MKSFLAGVSAGAAIGVLVAPQRGSETRRRVVSTAGELGDLAAEQVNRLKQALGDPQSAIGRAEEQAKSYAEQVTDFAGGAAETAKNAAQSLASKAGIGPLVMLNTASREDLLKVYGIGPVLAGKIIKGRPYTSEREVVDRDIIPQSAFKELKRTLKSA